MRGEPLGRTFPTTAHCVKLKGLRQTLAYFVQANLAGRKKAHVQAARPSPKPLPAAYRMRSATSWGRGERGPQPLRYAVRRPDVCIPQVWRPRLQAGARDARGPRGALNRSTAARTRPSQAPAHSRRDRDAAPTPRPGSYQTTAHSFRPAQQASSASLFASPAPAHRPASTSNPPRAQSLVGASARISVSIDQATIAAH